MLQQKALDLAYGNSEYNSVVCLGYHNTGTDGIYTIGYIPVSEVKADKLKFNKFRDYYITANTLKKRDRRAENLFSLKNIVIDIDCHDPEITKQEREELLEDFLWRMYRDCEIPEPNIIHETGRGLQLWWCLNEVSGSLLFLYKQTAQKLMNRLNALKNEYEDFEALDIDSASKNAVGFFRLFGSYNSKTEAQGVITIKRDSRYDLNELLRGIEVIEEDPVPEKLVAVNTGVSGQYIALNHKRADFIKWLIKSRKAPAGTETRDKLLFLFYNAAVQFMSPEMAQGATKQVNQSFKQPLDKLDYIFNYIDQKGFLKFKLETWFEFLELSEEERRKYIMQESKSNYTRDLKRKLAKEKRNQQILNLKKEGKTNIEIAEALNIGRNTVSRVINSNTPKIDKKAKIQEYRAKGLKIDEIIKLLGISKQTYYNILKKDRDSE